MKIVTTATTLTSEKCQTKEYSKLQCVGSERRLSTRREELPSRAFGKLNTTCGIWVDILLQHLTHFRAAMMSGYAPQPLPSPLPAICALAFFSPSVGARYAELFSLLACTCRLNFPLLHGYQWSRVRVGI